MRGIDTNAEKQPGTGVHYLSKMLETVPNALPLSGRILQKNPQPSQVQTTDSELDTVAASANSVSLTSAARAARMYDQVINTKVDCAFHFFAKRSTRLVQKYFVGGGEVYEIVAMNGNRRDFCRPPGLKKERDGFGRKRLGHPSARVARKDLHGVASRVSSHNQCLVKSALYGRVETDPWSPVRRFTCH
jgi:hypothetical protein